MKHTLIRRSAAFAACVSLLSSVLLPRAAGAASSAISIVNSSPGTATVGVPVTLAAGVSSSAGSITTCNLYVDNDDKGAMTVSGGTASRAYTFTSAQIYTVFVFCHDSAGNFNSGPNASVWAKAGSGGGYGSDIVAPVVSSVSPASAVANAPVTFSATVSDNIGIASCTLYVGGASQGAMTITGGTATKSYTFQSSGPFTVNVQCTDTSANTGTGTNTAVSVSPGVPGAGLTEGSLIKLACPSGAAADHPCKAVYYYAKDGKRHAFPNDKVYFTWFANFNDVKTVSSDDMAKLALGKNVTYRPGVKMVKFTTVAFVYAISKGGVLRLIKTEADASAIYGSDWNKKIDDISDAFFSSYSYGADITPAAPYNVTLELNGATTIDDNL